LGLEDGKGLGLGGVGGGGIKRSLKKGDYQFGVDGWRPGNLAMKYSFL